MKNCNPNLLLLSLVSGLLAFPGCTQESSTTSTSSTSAASADGSKYLLNEEPDGAQDVIKVRKAARDGDDVVIVGRIGGRLNPWIENRAAFFIVDGSLKACSDIEGDNCKTPWDYCCETSKRKTSSSVLVKVVDESGDVVKTDAKQLLMVKELSTVIVTGKANRNDAGNLTVLATGVYVKKK